MHGQAIKLERKKVYIWLMAYDAFSCIVCIVCMQICLMETMAELHDGHEWFQSNAMTRCIGNEGSGGIRIPQWCPTRWSWRRQ